MALNTFQYNFIWSKGQKYWGIFIVGDTTPLSLLSPLISINHCKRLYFVNISIYLSVYNDLQTGPNRDPTRQRWSPETVVVVVMAAASIL